MVERHRHTGGGDDGEKIDAVSLLNFFAAMMVDKSALTADDIIQWNADAEKFVPGILPGISVKIHAASQAAIGDVNITTNFEPNIVLCASTAANTNTNRVFTFGAGTGISSGLQRSIGFSDLDLSFFTNGFIGGNEFGPVGGKNSFLISWKTKGAITQVINFSELSVGNFKNPTDYLLIFLK